MFFSIFPKFRYFPVGKKQEIPKFPGKYRKKTKTQPSLRWGPNKPMKYITLTFVFYILAYGPANGTRVSIRAVYWKSRSISKNRRMLYSHCCRIHRLLNCFVLFCPTYRSSWGGTAYARIQAKYDTHGYGLVFLSYTPTFVLFWFGLVLSPVSIELFDFFNFF